MVTKVSGCHGDCWGRGGGRGRGEAGGGGRPVGEEVRAACFVTAGLVARCTCSRVGGGRGAPGRPSGAPEGTGLSEGIGLSEPPQAYVKQSPECISNLVTFGPTRKQM